MKPYPRASSLVIRFIAVAAALLIGHSAQAVNTANNYTGTSTSLGSTFNWSLGHVATVSEDANFNGFNSGISAATITNTAMNWGSLNLAGGSTKTVTIGNSSTTGDSSLTLGGVGSTGNSVAGSASGDLIYVKSPNTLNIQNSVGSGTQLLNLILGQSGNFNIGGTATISSAISDGGNAYGMTKTGAGTLTLTGTNTYTGATTVNEGTLTLGSGGLLAATSTLATGGNGIFNFSGAAAATQTVAGFNANQGFGTVNNTVSGTTLNLGAVTHSGGGMVDFNNTTGTIASTTTNTNGIIGPWAFRGTGTALDYAVANGADNAITSLGAATALPTSTGSASTNYTLAGAQTQTADTVGNTLRYTGGANTLDLGTTSLGLNGLMNAGTGLLTINGTGSAGLVTTGELDIVGNTGGGTATTSGITISSVISGAGSVVYGGVGTTVAISATSAIGVLTLSGDNTYNGGTVINSGALRASSSTALGTGAVTVVNGAQLQLEGGVTIANTININGGSALFSTTSSATPDLSGIVNLQSDSGIGLATNSGNAAMTLSGTLNLNGHTLTANTININPAVTISAVINGSGGITNSGNGVLLITNDNSGTYSGTTTVSTNGGTLQVGSDGALGSGTLNLNATSATLTVRSADTADHTLSNVVTLGGNTSTIYTFGAASTFTGNLTFTNTTAISLSTVRKFNVLNSQTEFDAGFTGASGGITKQTGTGTLVLNGANTYAGATTINAGTIQIGNGGTTGSLSTSSSITVASGATLAIKRSNAVVQGTDFATGISGAGGFTQAGSGTTTLVDNAFTGAINVNAGTLFINGVNTSASGVSVASGGRLGGVGGSVGAVTFNTGAALAYNIATASQSGGLTTTGITGSGLGSFTLYLTGAATGFDDTQDYSWLVLSSNSTDIGSISLTGITLDTSGFGQSFIGAFDLSKDATSIYVNYVATAVPEPSTCALIAGGALLCFACWRRRRGYVS